MRVSSELLASCPQTTTVFRSGNMETQTSKLVPAYSAVRGHPRLAPGSVECGQGVNGKLRAGASAGGCQGIFTHLQTCGCAPNIRCFANIFST